MLLTAQAVVAAEGWLTDFEQAQTQAKETGRPILVNFSGSDWCGWCIQLDNEVFDKAEFKAYTKDNLVLFVADFPQKTKLPEKLTKQNESLVQRYSVQGYPTVLLLNEKGALIGRTGYRPGGPAGYVEHPSELIAAHKAEASGPKSAAGFTTPKPTEYDAENDRYWSAEHGHWYPGKPKTGHPK